MVRRPEIHTYLNFRDQLLILHSRVTVGIFKNSWCLVWQNFNCYLIHAANHN